MFCDFVNYRRNTGTSESYIYVNSGVVDNNKNFVDYKMKKIVLFFLMMLPVAVFGQIRWSDEPGEKVTGSFKVFQVISDTKALACKLSDSGVIGIICLIYHDPETLYYDDAIIRASEKEEFRVVGTYTYETRQGYQKTVPVLVSFPKQKKSKKDKKRSDND